MVAEYLRLYTTESPRWDDVAHLVEKMDWTGFVNSTTLEYLTARGISEKWTKEMVESATRVNYGQVCIVNSLARRSLTRFIHRTLMGSMPWRELARWPPMVRLAYPTETSIFSRAS